MKAKSIPAGTLIRVRELGTDHWFSGTVIIAAPMSRSLAIDIQAAGTTITLLLGWMIDGEVWAWKEYRSGNLFEIDSCAPKT